MFAVTTGATAAGAMGATGAAMMLLAVCTSGTLKLDDSGAGVATVVMRVSGDWIRSYEKLTK